MAPRTTLLDWMTMRTHLQLCVGLLTVAVLFGGAAGHTASAQASASPQQDELSEEEIFRKRSGDASKEVPDWATQSSSPTTPSPTSVVTKGAPGGGPGNPNRTPIGGLGWLVAVGIGYGTYRVRKVRQAG